jgi:two-component system chemotaxis response regulator CheY
MGRSAELDLANVQILIVDDNRQMRFLVRSILRAAGLFRATEAESASEALNALGRLRIDLTILDWHMAPVDGLTLAKQIRRGDGGASDMPIVMLTAHTERSRVAAARDAGVHGIVRKPISTQLLLDRVGAALTDTRNFIRSTNYIGPDRRHVQRADYSGPKRRSTDESDFVLDDMPRARIGAR